MCQNHIHKEIVSTSKALEAGGPYSQAVIAGGFVYTSGQIPLEPSTREVVAGDIKVQTTRVLENLRILLEECGSSIDNVIKTTVYIKDMKQISEVNEVYGRYFEKEPPARSCVEVSRLPKDVGIEIEAVAIMHD